MIKVHGLGVGPLKWMTEGRKEVKELTGQPAVPVLVTDEGEAIADSKAIVEWAEKHPAQSAVGELSGCGRDRGRARRRSRCA